MINNKKFIDTLLVTGGLSNNLIKILQEMDLSDSEFALRNMLKNYKLCFKEEEDRDLGISIDLCLIDKRGNNPSSLLGLHGGYYIYNTFGTPCYDWGMICKFSQVEALKGHERDILTHNIFLKRYVSLSLDRPSNGSFTSNQKYAFRASIEIINEFLTTPIIVSKNNRIKINDNYCLVENNGGMLLVNTEYGFDQWVSVGFPISNVYVSLYDMVLEGLGCCESLVIKREHYLKIYENLNNCYKCEESVIEKTYTGYFSHGKRFIKIIFGG